MAEVVAAVVEPPRDGDVDVVAGRARASSPPGRGLEVLVVGLRHRLRVVGERGARRRRRRARPRPSASPGPATSSDGSTKSPSTSSLRAILNSGSATPERPGAVSTMFIVRRPQPSAMKYSSAAAITSAAVLAGRVRVGPDLEAAPVDAHRVAHALELRLALHRAREIELDVERDDVEPFQRPVVAHGHDVVEPVDADPPPPGVARVGGDRGAGMRVEALLELAPCRARRRSAPRPGRRRTGRRRPARRRTRSGGRSGSRTGT